MLLLLLAFMLVKLPLAILIVVDQPYDLPPLRALATLAYCDRIRGFKSGFSKMYEVFQTEISLRQQSLLRAGFAACETGAEVDGNQPHSGIKMDPWEAA